MDDNKLLIFAEVYNEYCFEQGDDKVYLYILKLL